MTRRAALAACAGFLTRAAGRLPANRVGYQGWNCVDLDTARQGPRHSYERCARYIVEKLEPIYV